MKTLETHKIQFWKKEVRAQEKANAMKTMFVVVQKQQTHQHH